MHISHPLAAALLAVTLTGCVADGVGPGGDTVGAAPPASAAWIGEGSFAVGDFAADWSLVDVNGDTVHLHDFAGRVIFLESGAHW